MHLNIALNPSLPMQGRLCDVCLMCEQTSGAAIRCTDFAVR